MSFWWVTLASLVVSATGAWAAVGIEHERADPSALGWGMAAGVGATLGATALYRGYARGQMAVAGPLSAVGAAAFPALVGAALGDRLPALGIVGVGVSLPAIWLMSSTSEGGADRTRQGVREGLVSGAGFAVEFIGLERSGHQSGLWPVAVSQSTALVLVVAYVLTKRPSGRRQGHAMTLSAAAGLLSLVATGLYFLAAQSGMLTVAAVLAALYPGITVLLAALILHERPDQRQVLGLMAGGIAVTLIVLT
jgi:drug/metabolite transporter (DMT)-like permease